MNFRNLYNHGFARLAVALPRCRIADPVHNAGETVGLMQRAAAHGAAVVLFPELGLSAYSCDDLFHQDALLDACERALGEVVEASRALAPLVVVGLPLRVDQRLFNVAAVVQRGRLLGVVPKTYLPNYGEFYEARQFASADQALSTTVQLAGQQAPFAPRLVFTADDLPLLKVHVEICEDLWTPIPPSSFAALAGASVLVNLSASNITVGKADYRRALVAQQAARCIAAYAYSAAGPGESTTDLAWDGHAMVAENGTVLAESARFERQSQLLFADVDLASLAHDRMRQTSFGASVQRHLDEVRRHREVAFTLGIARDVELRLERHVDRYPYVPDEPWQRDARCHEVYRIQVQGLEQRLRQTGIRKVVIGVSGGLDSTQALLVCARAMDELGLPRSNILAYTMPGFATGTRTRDQALRLMKAVGCSAHEIDIRPSCLQMLRDIGHPFADGQPVHDVTFENVQAGERTSHLFRLANLHGGIVVGTGDLSELALGWCTYGVGDHMSHYNVNASVPKTLVRFLIRWVAESDQIDTADDAVLLDILGTEISPELVPASADGALQRTEDAVGAYDLQDFNLYHTVRHGTAPRTIAFLAEAAWQPTAQERAQGLDAPRHDLASIKHTVGIFVRRFWRGSQFKRSCVPNGPKVGSGGSLSPRGDWRAPSDAEAQVWLDDWATIPDA